LRAVFVLYKMRLIYKKAESTRYLGHLDMLRTFIRGLRRANVPVKYSKGFNPHAVLTFALPIGVGLTSDCEIVDVEVMENINISEAINNINSKMPPNSIQVLSGEYATGRMPIIEQAEYIIDIESKSDINAGEINDALSSHEIMVEKISKKKTTQINIIDHIFSYKVLGSSKHSIKISVTISAGSTVNIKPQLVTEALKSAVPSLDVAYCLYHRKKFIFSDTRGKQ